MVNVNAASQFVIKRHYAVAQYYIMRLNHVHAACGLKGSRMPRVTEIGSFWSGWVLSARHSLVWCSVFGFYLGSCIGDHRES